MRKKAMGMNWCAIPLHLRVLTVHENQNAMSLVCVCGREVDLFKLE